MPLRCGLPVITTNRCIAGLELIENGVNGYILPVDNSKELANRIDGAFDFKIINSGLESLRKIKKYNFSSMVEEHIKSFNYMKKRGKQ